MQSIKSLLSLPIINVICNYISEGCMNILLNSHIIAPSIDLTQRPDSTSKQIINYLYYLYSEAVETCIESDQLALLNDFANIVINYEYYRGNNNTKMDDRFVIYHQSSIFAESDDSEFFELIRIFYNKHFGGMSPECKNLVYTLHRDNILDFVMTIKININKNKLFEYVRDTVLLNNNIRIYNAIVDNPLYISKEIIFYLIDNLDKLKNIDSQHFKIFIDTSIYNLEDEDLYEMLGKLNNYCGNDNYQIQEDLNKIIYQIIIWCCEQKNMQLIYGQPTLPRGYLLRGAISENPQKYEKLAKALIDFCSVKVD